MRSGGIGWARMESGTWERLGGSILQSCVPGRGSGDGIKAER